MNQATTAKLNIPEDIEGFSRRPYWLFKLKVNGRKLCRSELTVLGAIFSYSVIKDKPDARCNLSYAMFMDKYHCSRATVARIIANALEANLITQDKSNATHAIYKYVGDNNGIAAAKGYITTEDYLYKVTFTVRGESEPRHLTKSAIDILSLIKTHQENKGFTGSVRGIMSTLNLSKTTVQKALTLLMRSELIFRPEERRGINSYRRSTFTVNEKLLRKKKKEYRQSLVPAPRTTSSRVSPDVAAANLKAERESYYSKLQTMAQDRVDEFQRRLDADPKFHELDVQLRSLDIDIVKAEEYGSGDVEKLRKKQKSLKVQLRNRMKELGVSKEDLKLKYKCSKCSDSGFHPDGKMCDCYQQTRRRSP